MKNGMPRREVENAQSNGKSRISDFVPKCRAELQVDHAKNEEVQPLIHRAEVVHHMLNTFGEQQ